MRKHILNLSAAVMVLCLASLSEAKLKEGGDFPKPVLPQLVGAGNIDLQKVGGKVLIVDFWASWCEPCKIELPALNGFAKKYKAQGLVVVGVNLDEKKADALAFLKEHPMQIPIAYDGEKQVLAKKADIEVMPTSFIISANGKVAHRHEAFREGDGPKIEKEILELLKK